MPNLIGLRFKTGLAACFFLTSLTWVFGQSNYNALPWKFDAKLQGIYNQIINLETNEAIASLQTVQDPKTKYQRIYLQSLAECVDILITEDESRFAQVEKLFEKRLNDLDKASESPDKLFLLADLNLQLGFCHLNLGQNFSAILAIRHAYHVSQECIKKYPKYIPILKTNGVLQVMVGAIPDKYRWFLTLLGMNGSVDTGQRQLNLLRQSNISLSKEAGILFYTIKGLINQEFFESYQGITGLLKENPHNRLLNFLGINLLMKQSRSEEAYQLITNLDENPGGLSMIYLEYTRAEILMQKTQYQEAILSFKKFMATYQGSSFKKDAAMKISLCYYLQHQNNLAMQWWEKAKITGKAVAEPDVYASEMLEESPFPNEILLKARFFTDGGYLSQARKILESSPDHSFKTSKDRTEFIYRKARLEHRSQNLLLAEKLYKEVIKLNEGQSWYFGASSALQMGYILREAGNLVTAKYYFQKALDFDGHPYKYSIDGKARAALDQIKNTTSKN